MGDHVIRPARERDNARMLEIYTPYILNTTITFETEPPAPEAFLRRLHERQGRYPCLVAERDGRVVGYANGGPLASRAAYAWSAEAAIYLDETCRGRGIGGALYRALIGLLTEQGYRTLYALIAHPNPESEGFHERLGFVREGLLERAGFKLGRFVGVAYYAFMLNAAPPEGPPLSLDRLPAARMEGILAAAVDLRVEILPAAAGDLAEILALQRLAYQSEARILNNPDSPPLLQTPEEVEQEYRTGLILKAVDRSGRIVGSVRGRTKGETLYVGKLMVHPALRGQGMGTQLLRAIESACPRPRCELFTSNKSGRNLALYERLGCVRYREEQLSPQLGMVYLEKHNS